MTATAQAPLSRPGFTAVAGLAGGACLLAIRPILAGDGYPTATLVGVFATLLVLGALWPLPRSGQSGAIDGRATDARSAGAVLDVAAVLALGVVAFAAGRYLGGGRSPQPLLARVVVLNSLAAVAEEAFFRRFAFQVLLGGGALVATVGTAAVFAIVHVGVYGWWVFPLDLAAGLIFGWQRWASGRWWVPAVTHVAANLLVVL